MIIKVMDIIEFLMLMPIFNTQFMQRYYTTTEISKYIRMATFYYAISLFVTKKRKMSRVVGVLLIVQIELLLVSVYNGQTVENALNTLYLYGSTIMMVDIFGDRLDAFFRYVVIYSKF